MKLCKNQTNSGIKKQGGEGCGMVFGKFQNNGKDLYCIQYYYKTDFPENFIEISLVVFGRYEDFLCQY